MITGGTSGIGLATAKRIVAEGGEVGVTGRDQAHLDEAGASLPPGSLVLRNDAGDEADVAHLAEKVGGQMETLDGLFLNAGFGTFKPLEETDGAHVDKHLDVNVKGLALHLAALRPFLKKGASVVVTGSVSPMIGQAGGAIYAGTKGAVRGMTTAWAAELAGEGIRVNSIAPGPIETNFFAHTGMSGEDLEGFSEMVKGMVALGRFGTAEEVAAVACFLLSDDASFVTGSEYVVDGGMTYR